MDERNQKGNQKVAIFSESEKTVSKSVQYREKFIAPYAYIGKEMVPN